MLFIFFSNFIDGWRCFVRFIKLFRCSNYAFFVLPNSVLTLVYLSHFLLPIFNRSLQTAPYAHTSLECPKFVRVLMNLITSVQFISNMNKLIVGAQFISNSTYKFQCKMPAIRADRFPLQSSKFHLEVSCLCLWSIQFQLFCERTYSS